MLSRRTRREGFSLSSAPGEVIIKNVKPKVSGGKHEVIDETFRDSASFKETEDAEISIP